MIWKNYLKTARRNLLKRKLYTVINVSGLAIGITCFILLALYLHNEWTYDTFHANAAQLYRIRVDYGEKDQPVVHTAMNPGALGPAIKDFPDVKMMSRVYAKENVVVKYGDNIVNEKRFMYADAAFFQMFSFPLLHGDPATVLKNPGTVVLSEEMARKYFGTTDVIGKIIRINNNKDLQITGVAVNSPANTHLKFNFAASFSTLTNVDNWDAPNYYTYVLLGNNATPAGLHRSMADLIKSQMPEGGGATLDFVPEPVTGIHLHSIAGSSIETGGDIRYNYILAIVAVLLLLVACINFMNLATARSAERGREIGVRKALGAERSQLFGQFISESALVTALAIILGIFLAWAFLPAFNNLAGTSLRMGSMQGYRLYLLLAVVFVGTTLLAGTYPALFLSALRPVQILKGKIAISTGGKMRKTLVIFQFATSIFFIICTLVVQRQLHYIQHKKLGQDRSHILVLDGKNMDYKSLATLKNRLLQESGVQEVSASYDSPVNIEGGYTIGKIAGKPADFGMSITAIPVEKDYLKTMGIPLAAGEVLTDADIQDILPERENQEHHFYLNEAAVKQLGWTTDMAVGKRLAMNGRNGSIKGVMKDFHFASMKEKIAPIIVFPEYNWFGEILVKIRGDHQQEVITGIEKVWKNYYPSIPFGYHFMDEEFNGIYQTEYRISAILTTFSSVIIMISCLGLLGLAAFTAQQRTREIGIRKVMGATVGSIVALLSKDYIKLVVIALCMAAPVAWYAMHYWLEGFAYHAVLPVWSFPVAGLTAILIALVTVGVQSITAARMDPVKSLRTE
ncbi:ABC transporter permease [Chitinophaga nivalis]|uniref:ABC transporter permease n=1 Tax=Chitinophaga nivalis TaxID=2991709 RepID=A0ABT3IVV3_9BACT|nr:ABC transporter permease [Chitinophaga nivalis]MCW3462193.1 ABC transporter permease [Chitinophaga nivalis]MCW3488115.1 ABC transporter permease [Chitinophaga nivalis]